MANVNAAFGLRPVRSIGRANTTVNEYAHASDDTQALYIGDPVGSEGGDSTSGVAGLPDGTPYIIQASDDQGATLLRGAVVGVRPTLSNLTLQYCPASVALGILVADDPFQLFTIMCDGTLAASNIGKNIDLGRPSDGSTTTGLSGFIAETDSVATTTLPLRIIRMAPVISNALGANGVIEVLINEHELKSTTGN